MPLKYPVVTPGSPRPSGPPSLAQAPSRYVTSNVTSPAQLSHGIGSITQTWKSACARPAALQESSARAVKRGACTAVKRTPNDSDDAR